MRRLEFREILESIKIPEGISAEDMQRMVLPINRALLQMAPKQLFKYRTCCDKHISAFMNDEVWMSTSDLFNDPFDTLIQFDKEELQQACNALTKPEIFKAMTQYFANGGQIAPQICNILDESEIIRLRQLAKERGETDCRNDQQKQEMINLQIQLAFYKNCLPQIVQRFSTVVCFSEKIDSILMWSHYANNHEGFALGYDLMPFLLQNQLNLGLYPVVYGEKRYDANEFLLWMLCALLKFPVHNQDLMSSIKLLLYKSMDWEYEQEWRLISRNQANFLSSKSEAIIIKPQSIYYGCRISQDKYMELHEIAIKKGIKEHFMAIDDAADSYKMIVK